MEARGEVGLEIRPKKLLGVYCFDKGKLNFVFLARVEDGSIVRANPMEVLSAAWMPVEHALALPGDAIFRPARLAAILHDVEAGRSFPADLIRDIR